MIDGVAISYGDIAVGAKEAFAPSAQGQADFSKIEQLKAYNLIFPSYANPCEGYSLLLDGEAVAFPENTQNENLGVWTSEISDSDGTINMLLTLQSEELYTSQGFTVTFDEANGIYCTDMEIAWYKVLDGEELLDTRIFNPDSAKFFCKNYVEKFNKVVINFKKINMPDVRMRLHAIDYGYGVIFYGDQLKNANQKQKLDPISSEIAINPFTFTLSSNTDMEYHFQKNQPISAYQNGELVSTNFVKSSKRTGRRTWNITCEDYIGILDSKQFKGGMYNDYSVTTLIDDIFVAAGVLYTLDESFAEMKLTGHIPFTTCREALKQAAFAIQGAVITSGSDKVRIVKLSDETSQTVNKRRILQGQSFDIDDIVTGVELSVHKYRAVNDEQIVYEAEESGTGIGIVVKFSEPLHSLEITNGKFEEYGTNYAIFNANEGCVLKGKKYEHSTTSKYKRKQDITADTEENIKSITNATLVSTSNADMILDRCFDYLTKSEKTNLSIVEALHVFGGDYIRYRDNIKYSENFKYSQKMPKIVEKDASVNVGDVIEAETEYLGNISGRIIEQNFSLMSGNIVKKAVMV